MFKYPNDGTDISGVFGVADIAEPEEIVAALVTVLNFGVVGPD